MAKFYFTYGLDENYPYVGGWTEIIAPNQATAVRLFRVYHPDRIENILNCADVYTEERFRQTSMYKNHSNLGEGCHEVIKVARITKRRMEK